MKRRALLWAAAFGLLVLGGSIAFVEGWRNARANTLANALVSLSDRVRPAPEFREVTIPAGTMLSLSLDNTVGSATSRVDEPVNAHVTRSVVVDGVTAIPGNSELSGAVTAAVRSARVKGRAYVAIRFDRLRPADAAETYAIRTPDVRGTAPGTKKKDALEIGIPAAVGAVLGGVLGGGKGALIGTAVGGGAGAGYVMTNRGLEVAMRRGAALSVRLLRPVTVRVPTSVHDKYDNYDRGGAL